MDKRNVPLRVLVARLETEAELAKLALIANDYELAADYVRKVIILAEQLREVA